jgi:2-methylisocitrate lyase-like PEP mutase family enzyme
MFLDHQDNNTYNATLKAGADTILIPIRQEAKGIGELANAVLSKLILCTFIIFIALLWLSRS